MKIDSILFYVSSILTLSIRIHTSFGQESTIDDLSAELTLIRTYFRMPGLLGMAMKNGRIVGQGAAGLRRECDETPLLVTDRINIGSCSKWMTATIAGRLVDRSIISWTTKISDCFTNSSIFHPSLRNATIEQFLAHRSGVQQSTTFYARYLNQLLTKQGTIRQIRRWVVETVLKDPPEVTPGEYLYANQGYTIAAAMMEQLTGLDWEELIEQHVFKPLNMTSAMIGVVYDDNLPPVAPVGHDLPFNEAVAIPRPLLSQILLHNDQAATGPAGYIACTLEDWLKFLRAHIVGVQTGYLTAETDARLKRPFIGIEGYGLGVSAYNRSWATPGQALVHSGDIFGQDTVFWMTPGRDLITVAYTNCRSIGSETGRALDNVASLLISRYAYNRKVMTNHTDDPIILDHMSIMPKNV